MKTHFASISAYTIFNSACVYTPLYGVVLHLLCVHSESDSQQYCYVSFVGWLDREFIIKSNHKIKQEFYFNQYILNSNTSTVCIGWVLWCVWVVKIERLFHTWTVCYWISFPVFYYCGQWTQNRFFSLDVAYHVICHSQLALNSIAFYVFSKVH